MKDDFVKIKFDNVFRIDSIITVFYMELSKDFSYGGEKHDFWEMVYIDKGEMLCTADTNTFTLKSGELTFHKPDEFHNLKGNGKDAPNVTILTFECKSRAMKDFEGKIFQLDAEEKALIATLFEEALSLYKMEDEYNPLLQKMIKLPSAPYGSSQMTKNLLEIFLIKLKRNKDCLTKESRTRLFINGVSVSYEVEEIITYLKNNIYTRVTIDSLASALGKSPATLKKQFSLSMNTGIIDYYNALKINEAKKLIREGKYNFQEISNMLSFDTPQYFSKCFKDRTRLTPSQYKKSIMK